MEPERLQASVIEYFAELDDPRRFNRRHKLLNILVIAICAALAGVDPSTLSHYHSIWIPAASGVA